jgi:DNA-binding transcriptional LysR family regulator
MDPGWELYRTFLAAVEQRSLSGAARALGLTQPTVGRHLDALEEALGVPLFTRSQRGLLPTEVAEDLRPYAAALAATSASLLRAASSRRDVAAGTVRISASEVMAIEVLPPIVAALQNSHPAIRVELSASDDVEDLLERQADVAVRMTEPQQAALIARRVGDTWVALFGHREYLARHGTPANVAELARHRLVGFDRETAFVRTIGRRYPALAQLTYAFAADSYVAQLAAIRAGVGIGMCQLGIAARHPALVPVLPGILELAMPTWVVMHENLSTSLRCRVAFDALVSGLGAYLADASPAKRAAPTDSRVPPKKDQRQVTSAPTKIRAAKRTGS